MFSAESRPLADAEREQLRARIRRVGRRLTWEPLGVFVLTVGFFGFGIPAMATERSQSLPGRLLFIAGFIFVYVMVVRGLPANWREARAERRKLRDALDENLVEVARYEAHGAIALIDEQPGWILDLGAGQLLYLRGIDTYPDNVDDPDGWPSTHIETAWVPGAGIWLRTEALGDGLSPVPLVDPSELDPGIRFQLETPTEGSDAVQRVIPGWLQDQRPMLPPES